MFTGLRVLFADLGIYVSEVKEDRSSRGWSTCYRGSVSGENYRSFARRVSLPVLDPIRERCAYIVDGGYFHIPVTEVFRYEVDDILVYNMEVEEDHSYVANGLINHNCFEVIPDDLGQPYEFRCVDASTIRLAATYDGYRGNSKPVEFQGKQFSERWRKKEGVHDDDFVFDGEGVHTVQVLHGRIENIFTHADLPFCIRNDRSDLWANGYGFAEGEMALNSITRMLWSEEYNARKFKQGSLADGFVNLKGEDYDPALLESFQRQWQANVVGVENCLDGSTVIWTKEEGSKTIQETLGDLVERKVNIWTGTEWSSGLVYRTSEPKKLCVTKLGNGIEIKTSPDHRFLVIGSTGEPEWRVQKDLVEGDFVLVNKQDVVVESKLPEYKNKKITPELMEVLGWSLGDGYIRSSGKAQQLHLFYHHEKEIDIRERHYKILQEFEPAAYKKDVELSEERCEYIKSFYGFHEVASRRLFIRVCKSDFVRWLVDTLKFNASCQGKEIPSWIFQLPTEYKSAFLRGFFSADGSLVSGRSPIITISSDRVREQTRLLLLSMGIRTTSDDKKLKIVRVGVDRQKEYKGCELRIKDRSRFFELIGFIQPHKQPNPSTKNRDHTTNRISSETVVNYIRKVRCQHDVSPCLSKQDLQDIVNIRRGTDGCSLTRLIRFMEQSGLTVPAWMTSFYFEPVVKIERSDSEIRMFDVSIDTDEHRFVANGIITHNSHRLPMLHVPEGVEFVNIGNRNNEMEYQAWLNYLIKIISSMFRIDPSEVNFDLVTGGGGGSGPLFESKHEWKIKHSRDKGLRPLLKWVAEQISTYIIDPLDDSLYFDFIGLDQLTEQDRISMLTTKGANWLTFNEVRQIEGYDPIPGGNVINSPTFLQNYQAEQEKLTVADPLSPWPTSGEQPQSSYGKAEPIPLYLQQTFKESVEGQESGGEGEDQGGGFPPGMMGW